MYLHVLKVKTIWFYMKKNEITVIFSLNLKIWIVKLEHSVYL